MNEFREMFNEERQHKIEEILSRNKSIKVAELSKLFNVSESTIRRDLKVLAEKGIIKRTHGGAIINEGTHYEPSYFEKETSEIESKRKIGKAASQLIKEGDTIILDSGTTTLEIARNIKNIKLTVVTNSILITIELSRYKNIELIVTGGLERWKSKALVGPIAEEIISRFRVDKAFVGSNAISLEDGIMTPDVIEGNTKKAMCRVAKEVYIVADHTKFEKKSFVKFADFKEITAIITDDGLSTNIASRFVEKNIKLIIAGEESYDYNINSKPGN